MKKIVNRLGLIVLATAFLGTAAYAQDLKAGVPFGFRVPGGGITAGNYVVHMDNSSGGKVVHLYNADTHKSVLALASSVTAHPAYDIQPRLVFRCSDDAGCALSEIWTPNGGYAIPVAKAARYQYVASIPLTVNQGN